MNTDGNQFASQTYSLILCLVELNVHAIHGHQSCSTSIQYDSIGWRDSDMRQKSYCPLIIKQCMRIRWIIIITNSEPSGFEIHFPALTILYITNEWIMELRKNYEKLQNIITHLKLKPKSSGLFNVLNVQNSNLEISFPKVRLQMAE